MQCLADARINLYIPLLDFRYCMKIAAQSFNQIILFSLLSRSLILSFILSDGLCSFPRVYVKVCDHVKGIFISRRSS